MSAPLLLRVFVTERLTAAAEEILQVFERTIEKYEEEASRSKQENDRLRGLLQEFSHQRDLPQSSICKEETPAERHHCEHEPNLSTNQTEPEPRHIKEEDQEVWACQQDGEQAREFRDANDMYLPLSAVWEGHEQEDTKPSLKTPTQNSDSEEQFEELPETKALQFMPHFAPFPPPQTQIQDGREHERPATSFMSNQTKTDQNQGSIITSRESAEVSHMSSLAPGYHCYLCDKSFASKHHLINHALRMHSMDAGFPCAVCGKASESTESLNVHLKSHKASRCCHVCGKQCNSSTALAEHMTSHTGVKLHRCQVCGKECSRKGDLKIHMRIHTGEKPFCCSFCCKSFTHSGHLKKHLRSHTGERPHRCNVCGKGYLQSAHLKYHLGTHTQKY
ncbi:zinc finger protein 596-like [Hippoglossus hippoglossus]|uniref:zinc finger protein 596-like n=1 Tax=Hippoglossus hippoglossus TaxID=8267 RepID=UPI00148CEDD2|nr:zinc finger protein 596-like [Hippoglossus hippoglossus]